MQINEQSFQRLHEDHSQIANNSSTLAMQTNEAFAQATKDYLESTCALKKAHKKEITERDFVIKSLVIALIAAMLCTIGLGTKIIINKC